MTDLTEQICALLDAPPSDVGGIEHTLTDGYARALSLEAEHRRLERRVVELSRGLEQGDVSSRVRELSKIAKLLDHTDSDLSELRDLLVRLRRHAENARAGSSLRPG